MGAKVAVAESVDDMIAFENRFEENAVGGRDGVEARAVNAAMSAGPAQAVEFSDRLALRWHMR